MTECYVCGDDVQHDQGRFPHEGEPRDLCEKHYLAAYFLAMTREEPPFVDVGLYQEATFYGRQLAATVLGQDPESAVSRGEQEES